MRIDAHQHFWKFDPERHSWITPEMAAIRRDFLPRDLQVILRDERFDGCVTVQVDQTAKETLTLLRLADQNAFMRGVVGWIDLRAEEIEERLSFLTRYKKLKGFRHIVQSEAAGFLLQQNFLRGVGFLRQFNFTYDVLIYPHQLDEATQFVALFPEQKFVLDHLAKPSIRQGTLEPWKSQIKKFAAAGNVHCKLSGLVTEADWKNWKQADFLPYIDCILDAFGPSRIMYGSDWPVCQVAATYQQQLQIIESYLNRLSMAEKQLIMGENAVQFYNL
jgi:L-fuconolactonase